MAWMKDDKKLESGLDVSSNRHWMNDTDHTGNQKYALLNLHLTIVIIRSDEQ